MISKALQRFLKGFSRVSRFPGLKGLQKLMVSKGFQCVSKANFQRVSSGF